MAENIEKKEEETTTEVEGSELEVRFQAFIKEYKELVDKHKVDTMAFPMFTPDGQGGYKVIIHQQPVDISNQPAPSPLITK